MKGLGRAIFVCIVTWMLALIIDGPVVAAPDTIRLSGRILGSSGKSVVYVALWHAANFLERPVEQVRIDAGAELVFRFDVPPGRWAVSAFEDRNGNGILDMGLFGPKEPSGFWRSFKGWHKPRFDEVGSLIERDTTNADITVR